MAAAERIQVDAAVATGLENGEIQDQDRQVLGDHHHRQYPRGQVDLAIPQDRDACHRHQRIGPPRQHQAEGGFHGAADHPAEHAVQADLQDVIGKHRQHPGRATGQAAQPTGGERVETAGIGQVARHGGVAHRERQQHQQGQDQQRRGARAVTQHDADGEAAGDHTQRACRRYHEEDDKAHTQGATLELRGAVDRVGYTHAVDLIV